WLEFGNLTQGDLALDHGGIDGHLGFHDVLLQGIDPAFVHIVHITLHTGIKHFPDRLDHGIGNGHVHIAATPVQLYVEGTDYHHLAGADDVSHGRVDLRVDVLEVHLHHRIPGLFHVLEDLLQHHLHDPDLGRGKFPPLNLGVPAVTAEKVVHQFEHQLGIQDEQTRPP